MVDDASPDGTGDVADALAAGDPAVHVLHRAGKLGLGTAYVAGFGWALQRGYDVVVEMDADGSHRARGPAARCSPRLGDADLVLGARWVPGGRVVNWPRRREVLSRVGNGYTRLVLGLPLRDATGGFRAYRAGGAGAGRTWRTSTRRGTASRSTWRGGPSRPASGSSRCPSRSSSASRGGRR